MSATAAHLPNLFPALDRATEAALRESIKRFGVISSVVKDQHGRILDGHHRSRIAREIGVDFEARVMNVADDDEARAISETLNNDRRHMEPEQRRKVVAALRRSGHSLRTIARAVGVDEKTIRKDVARAGADGSAPAEVVGLDGKRYPAQKPARDDDELPAVSPQAKARVSGGDVVARSAVAQKLDQGDEMKAREMAETMGVTIAEPIPSSLAETPLAVDGPATIEGAVEQLAAGGDEAAQRALAAKRRAWHIELLAEASAITARLGSNSMASVPRWSTCVRREGDVGADPPPGVGGVARGRRDRPPEACPSEGPVRSQLDGRFDSVDHLRELIREGLKRNATTPKRTVCTEAVNRLVDEIGDAGPDGVGSRRRARTACTSNSRPPFAGRSGRRAFSSASGRPRSRTATATESTSRRCS